MPMADFLVRDAGYLTDSDTATFCASFHVLRENCSFTKALPPAGGLGGGNPGGRGGGGGRRPPVGDPFQGKFVWKIEHFSRLKDLLKKRKITGLCMKSRRFRRALLVRPVRPVRPVRSVCAAAWPPDPGGGGRPQRGGPGLPPDRVPTRAVQPAKPPVHVPGGALGKTFPPPYRPQPACARPDGGPARPGPPPQVTDPRVGGDDWSCFVSHRLSVVNQRGGEANELRAPHERSVAKESQNR